MPAKGVLGWLKSGVEKLVDPNKQERIAKISKVIHRRISEDRNQFDLDALVRNADLDPSDLLAAIETVYTDYLLRFWEDAVVTEKEQKTLHWLSTALRLNSSQEKALNDAGALRVFEKLLAASMDERRVTPETGEKLRSVAQWMGANVPHLMRTYFSREGEGFIRAIFADCIEDGQLFDDEWRAYLSSTAELGLSHAEAVKLISIQSKAFVEHILSDAKSDERLTPDEERTLGRLVEVFDLPTAFREYVRSEVARLREFTRICDGILPSLPAPKAVATRSGEIVHYHGNATLTQIRTLKSGDVVDTFSGTLTVTDNRLIFSSESKPFSLKLTSVISFDGDDRAVHLQSNRSTSGEYRFHDQPELAWRILFSAIRKANQTLVQTSSDGPDRHIPREVRQRVWQKYGGKCVDCGDEQYLEFDHIIPVSRGGSNFDNNIQLLCRRCNLKKSDKI